MQKTQQIIIIKIPHKLKMECGLLSWNYTYVTEQ